VPPRRRRPGEEQRGPGHENGPLRFARITLRASAWG
jgi:hypothetical protein